MTTKPTVDLEARLRMMCADDHVYCNFSSFEIEFLLAEIDRLRGMLGTAGIRNDLEDVSEYLDELENTAKPPVLQTG